MGLIKRVLVLGPASTIIEQGLREKFRDLMNRKEFSDKLPTKYRGKAINLLTDKYRITGVPFYNNTNENEFRKSMEDALGI